ncbi:ABC transporter permease [Paracoccus sulfuroxidans]|uniref:NitT/TauT family transport system permease protein n=1 Tax=Paracoccus sulfuroxidans TaxID=384678 RepID=A0A562NNZ6_9RHOB|nr:ABC transporter permease [Paracoccus sulfuroxidans]TWI33914.1 NitT/TauT family transport system permease protein [Paracoccus sulfuroxidans]
MAQNTATADNFDTVIRAEYERTDIGDAKLEDVQRKLPLSETLWNSSAFRKTLILLALAIIWQIYGVWLDNPMIFPTLTDTLGALWANIVNGTIPTRLIATLKVLVVGYVIGVILATIFTTIAVSSRIGTDLLSTLTAMFNPLPAIALLPLALLWFGLGTPSLVFVIVNSVLWAVALNMHTGFLTVSDTMRMAGQTFGLRGMRYVVQLLIPAAFPAILAGLKIGWAFAWRTLIAAELVFGVSSGQGGLGWFIFENRNLLDTPAVFAGLLTVMSVGLFVEGVIFRFIENRTVRKWGMQRG